jgi:hypothetical protein
MSNAQIPRVQKICTLWTHDDNFSRDDIVFNADKFPELLTAPGTLLQIVAIDSATVVRDFQPTAKGTHSDASQAKSGNFAQDHGANRLPKRSRRGSVTITVDENGSRFPGGRDIDDEKAYVFAIAALPADLRSKYANLQVGYARRYCRLKLTTATGIYIRENCKSLRFSKSYASHCNSGMMLSIHYTSRADVCRLMRRDTKHIT